MFQRTAFVRVVAGALLLIITACGGDPVVTAPDCLELVRATLNEVRDLPYVDPSLTGGERDQALDDWDLVQEELEARVEERANQLIATDDPVPGACTFAIDASSALLSANEPPPDEFFERVSEIDARQR